MMSFQLHSVTNSISLGIFRIAIAITGLLFCYTTLGTNAFDFIPHITSYIYIEMLLLTFLAFGFQFDRISVVFFLYNFLLTFIYHSLIGNTPIILYLFMFISLIIFALPLHSSLSVDKLLSNKPVKPIFIKQYYLLFIQLSLGLFYFDASIQKLINYDLWILKSDQLFKLFFVITPTNQMNNFISNLVVFNPSISTITAYATILYQLSFLPVILFLKNPKIKLYFIFTGILIHIGSAIVINLNFLAIFTIILYIPLIHSRHWYKFFSFFRKKNISKIEVFYDNTCSFCTSYIYLLKIFDFGNKFRILGKDLSKTNEILFIIDGHNFSGIIAFREAFKQTILYYPAYLLLKIPFIFTLSTNMYKSFADKRGNLNCKIKTHTTHLGVSEKTIKILTIITILNFFIITAGNFHSSIAENRILYTVKEFLNRAGFFGSAAMFTYKINQNQITIMQFYIKSDSVIQKDLFYPRYDDKSLQIAAFSWTGFLQRPFYLTKNKNDENYINSYNKKQNEFLDHLISIHPASTKLEICLNSSDVNFDLIADAKTLPELRNIYDEHTNNHTKDKCFLLKK